MTALIAALLVLVMPYSGRASAARPQRVVTDIAGWTHPTKAVLRGAGVDLKRVELHRAGVYPVFFVSGPSIGPIVTAAFASRLAAANGWFALEIRHAVDPNDPSLVAPANESSILVDQIVVVTTDRAKQRVTVRRLLSDADVLRRVTKAIGFTPQTVDNGGETVHIRLVLDDVPAVPFAAPGFWTAAVIEDHADHVVTRQRYDVDASTGAIWAVDVDLHRTRVKG